MKARKSLRERFQDDDADPEGELYALLRDVVKQARECEGGRGMAQLLDAKIKALTTLNKALAIDDDREERMAGKAESALAQRVLKFAQEGKSEEEIVDLLMMTRNALKTKEEESEPKARSDVD